MKDSVRMMLISAQFSELERYILCPAEKYLLKLI